MWMMAGDFDALVELHEHLATTSVEARRLAAETGLTQQEIAELAGLGRASVRRLIRGAAYNSTLDTLGRFAWACGYELRVSFVRRAP